MVTILPLICMATICPVESVCFEISFPEVYEVELYRPRAGNWYNWIDEYNLKDWYKRGCSCRPRPHVPEPATICLLGCGCLLFRRLK